MPRRMLQNINCYHIEVHINLFYQLILFTSNYQAVAAYVKFCASSQTMQGLSLHSHVKFALYNNAVLVSIFISIYDLCCALQKGIIEHHMTNHS